MKKGDVLMLFVLMLLLLIVQFASASVEWVCSDGKEISWSQKEIKEGSTKIIGMINIALIGADESAAFDRSGVSLIIDAKKVLLINKSSSNVKINGKDYPVSLINATRDFAKIKFNGQTKEILLDEFEIVSKFPVYLDNSYVNYSGNLPAADLIIGSSQLYLTSGENPYQKMNVSNTTYLIELISASDGEAVLRVSSCPYANIIETKEYEKIIQKNETNSSNNASKVVLNNKNSTLIKKQIGEECLKDEECLSEYCNEEKCSESTRIRKIISWFKKTFKWK